MSAKVGPTSLFWRATAALLRRSGTALTRVATDAYVRSFPGLTNEERQHLASNEQYRNCHAGKRCFVIGNGPSIQRQDLSLLANDITFVMNAFWKHPIVRVWQPTYYFFSDPVMFDRSSSAKEFFDSLHTHITKATFFVPLQYKTIIEEEGLLPIESTSFFGVKRRVLGEDSQKTLDLTRAVAATETIAQTAIMAAIYMGCSPIYLVGLDHDWLAHHGESGYNFYKGLTLNNHPKVHGKLGDYGMQIESLLRVWRSYGVLRDIVDERGLTILNATDGGFLDVFPRVDYESLFSSGSSS